MYTRLPKYVPLFLVWALAVSGCERGNDIGPTAPAPVDDIVFTAEPATIAPEFFSAAGCRERPFGARFRISARSRHDFFIHSTRFHFIDRSGVRFVPTAMQVDPSNPPFFGANPVPTPVTTPTSSPIPVPGTIIPVPGMMTFGDGFLISGGRLQTFPFFLRFGCGAVPDGTLFGDFDLRDRHGRRTKSQIRARIAG